MIILSEYAINNRVKLPVSSDSSNTIFFYYNCKNKVPFFQKSFFKTDCKGNVKPMK